MRIVFLRVAVFCGTVTMVLFLACAKRGVPPGGPLDTTEPYVEEISPAGGSVGVDLGSEISLTFSEPMKKRTVETGVVVSPPCLWRKRYWKGQSYIMEPLQGLRDGVTYLVSVSNKAQDAHGVAMKSTFVSGFSTGDTLNAGVISGSVAWKKMDVEGAVVFLFDAAVESLAVFPPADPLYVTLSGSKGLYEIPFVDTQRRYMIFAIIDKNLNAEYDEGEDVGCHNGELVFRETSEIEGIDITVCGETLMGGISGSIDTSSVEDSVAVAVAVRSVEDPSRVYNVRPDNGGLFEIGCVEPGDYSIHVFYDFNANLNFDSGDSILVEPPDTVRVHSCAEPPVVEIEFKDED
jgi:hypothetical protein